MRKRFGKMVKRVGESFFSTLRDIVGISGTKSIFPNLISILWSGKTRAAFLRMVFAANGACMAISAWLKTFGSVAVSHTWIDFLRIAIADDRVFSIAKMILSVGEFLLSN